ncbi:DUF4157 domain-containing protein [Mycobacterium sp. KBS0706]|uniref:eCIS core domain-containing protein n=1 Tax=Mycobacterium sp. KBS0706 TaxID=2578109 RepID=UPI00163D7ECA|nr:DUF4157 domain-containing protein [Mycobacterium sp. KBS0706]
MTNGAHDRLHAGTPARDSAESWSAPGKRLGDPWHDRPQTTPGTAEATSASPGQALDASTRAFMEPRFGRDFSHVRVHADQGAGASAQAIDAHAYTIGRDVVFGPGRYRPDTRDGRTLIAHELTHVVQQGRSGPSLQTYRVGAADTAAEREAGTVSQLVGAGGAAPPIGQTVDSGTIQRAAGGAIGGGIAGAAFGAGIGAAGGWVGALVGGVIGGVIGMVAGDVATSEARTLNSAEKAEATLVFGTSLNFATAKVSDSAPVMTIGGYARTPFDTAYLPRGYLSKPLADYMPLLIHELTHAWQTQHGISVVRKTATAMRGQSAYDFGGAANLVTAHSAGKKFLDFNTEQQASICGEFYETLKAGGDVSAYLPFIEQVKRGGRVP